MQEVKRNNMYIESKLTELREAFIEAGDPSKVEYMSAYLKNKFECVGLQKPVREKIVKPWLKSMSGLNWSEQKKAATWLWKQDEREFQYVAMELLFKNKKQWTEESIDYFVKLIQTKSWWDTVDFLASTLTGSYFVKFPSHKNNKISEWIKSKNMWMNRSAMIFQLKYKYKTDVQLLFESITPHLSSSEFFIQKAIGWSLRQLAYSNAAIVKKFVKEHDLKPLSKREALKHL